MFNTPYMPYMPSLNLQSRPGKVEEVAHSGNCRTLIIMEINSFSKLRKISSLQGISGFIGWELIEFVVNQKVHSESISFFFALKEAEPKATFH